MPNGAQLQRLDGEIASVHLHGDADTRNNVGRVNGVTIAAHLHIRSNAGRVSCFVVNREADSTDRLLCVNFTVENKGREKCHLG